MSLPAMLAKRAPAPDKLRAMGGGAPAPVPAPAEPDTDDRAADEGVDAAGESAAADAISAMKAGDAAGLWSALKEIHGLCADAETDGEY